MKAWVSFGRSSPLMAVPWYPVMSKRGKRRMLSGIDEL